MSSSACGSECERASNLVYEKVYSNPQLLANQTVCAMVYGSEYGTDLVYVMECEKVYAKAYETHSAYGSECEMVSSSEYGMAYATVLNLAYDSVTVYETECDWVLSSAYETAYGLVMECDLVYGLVLN